MHADNVTHVRTSSKRAGAVAPTAAASPRRSLPRHAAGGDFDIDDPRYVAVPGLMWAAVIAAALLGPPATQPTGDLASPGPEVVDTPWGA